MSAWNYIRRVPMTVEEATQQKQREQDRRLNLVETSNNPPFCIQKTQNAGEVMVEAYAEIPGLSWTTTIESAWRIQMNIDTEINPVGGISLFRCLVGGVEQNGVAAFAVSSALRTDVSQVWHTGLVAVGTVIMIQAKHEAGGTGKTFQVHSRMTLDQVR